MMTNGTTKMNFYFFYANIFDRGPNYNLKAFPKRVPVCSYAENYLEAQRDAVDQLWDPDPSSPGILAKNSTPEDAPDRFNIVFDDTPELERPVVWADEINEWIWGDEDYDLQIKEWYKCHGVALVP